MLTTKEQAILDVLEPLAADRNVEIVTVEIVGAKKSPVIRVYIDVEGGVSFEELSQAQSWIDAVIEKIDPFPGAYMLEVSSPGIDRPLRTQEHFARQIGHTIVVQMSEKVNDRLNFTGTLINIANECLSLQCEEHVYSLPIGKIKRAHLKGTVDFK